MFAPQRSCWEHTRHQHQHAGQSNVVSTACSNSLGQNEHVAKVDSRQRPPYMQHHTQLSWGGTPSPASTAQQLIRTTHWVLLCPSTMGCDFSTVQLTVRMRAEGTQTSP